ncbi:MAG: sulfatase [Acidobacteriota bacterium]
MLLWVAAASCRPSPPPAATAPATPQPTPVLLDRAQLYSPRDAFDWQLAGELPMEAAALAAQLPHAAGSGIQLQGETVVRWPVELDASELDALRVTLLYPRGAEAELSWRSPNQDFDASRSLYQRRGDGQVALDRILVFELLSHPGWSGQIAELQLRFVLRPDETRFLKRLRGQVYRWKDAVLDPTRSWQVDLGHSARTAWLTPDGQALERAFEVPAQARLRFAYGATSAPTRGIDFRIERLADAGAIDLFEDLFEARLDHHQLDRWHEAELELEGEGPTRLRFTARGDTGSRALPAWSGLEVTPRPEDPRPSIVLILVDTLRADRLPLYGYPHDTAPHLTAWAERSAITFDDAVVQAPWTLPSHASLFSGLNATRHGINHTHTVVPESQQLLAEWLRDAGYATAAVTGGAFLHPKYGLAQGFDRFDTWPTLGEPERELETAVDRAIRWTQELPRPFLLFLHTFDVHDYLIYRRTAGAEHEAAGDWYDQRIRHTDSQLGRLLDHLQATLPEDELVVVLTSDHGEGLEDGPAGHGFLSENNLHVPLIVQLPAGHEGRTRAGQRIRRQVRSIDIAPTLLALAGVDHPELDGTSLLPVIRDAEAPFPDLALSYAAKRNLGLALRHGGRWKAIVDNTAWTADAPQHRFFDLRSDPLAVRDLAFSEAAPPLAPLLKQASGLLESLPGLRLRFTNASDAPLYFRLGSRMIGVETVKALGLPADRVIRDGAYQARIEVPPSADFTLHLEEVIDDPLRVVAWRAGESEVDGTSFQLAAAEGLQAIVATDVGWRLESPTEATPASGLTLRQRGRLEAARHGPANLDPDLRRRLQALGYLD